MRGFRVGGGCKAASVLHYQHRKPLSQPVCWAPFHHQLPSSPLCTPRPPRNNKGVVSDWRIALALPLFWIIDLLLSIRPIAQALFNNVRDREVLTKVLRGVYRCAQGLSFKGLGLVG